MSSPGRVELIVGPMFAGKTTELMRRVRREMHARRSCFIIKYANDVRYDQDSVASHDKITLRACAAVRQLCEVGTQWSSYDVIAIDEGQFFDDLVSFCRRAADEGKTVMVSALDGDYLCRPFGRICELVPHCEAVTKLTAVCMMCHERQASFTRRTVDSDERELIGGAEMYIATCRACYNAPGPLSSAVVRHVHETMRQVERVCLAPYLRSPASQQQQQQHNDSDADVHTPCNSVDSSGCKTPVAEDAGAAAEANTDCASHTRSSSSSSDGDASSTTATSATTTTPTSDAAAATATASSTPFSSTARSAAREHTASAAATASAATATAAQSSKKRAREHNDSMHDGDAAAAAVSLSQAQRVLVHDDDY